MNNTNRRTFIKKSLTILTAVPFLPSLGFTQELAPVDETSQKSLSLGYLHDGTKVDTVKFPKKAGAGASQICDNCQLAVQRGLKAPGASGVWAKCALFPEGLVNAQGWCNSWVQKVGV